ncbi:hypothetical protein ACQ4PT_004109 [Festuca glaucescens]
MDDDDGCEVCAMWRELANFKSDGAKRFLVVASNGFRDSLQEIGSHLRTMISPSKPVTLEAPNGHVYPVEVKEELGDIVLRSGWNEFVNANHIEDDDYILFVSLVNSIFKNKRCLILDMFRTQVTLATLRYLGAVSQKHKTRKY